MKKTTIIVCVLPWVAWGTGCGEGSKQADLARLRKKVDELAQKVAAREQQLESVNNRLFLLEDKVDTSRVAIQRRAQQAPLRLPVVRIRPEDVAEPPASSSPGAPQLIRSPDARAGGRSIVAQEDVEYAGAATKPQSGQRLVLRLHGEGQAGGPTARPLNGPNPSSVREKIPVVALPKRKVARAMAKEPPPQVGAMRAYNQALGLYRAGRMQPASKAFERFVRKYPKHAYADNALYWLGECHYDLGDYQRALKVFRQCVEKHPNGNKAPAALLKMGFSYLKLNEKHNARTVLAQVVEIFPRTGVARLASATLSKLQ